MSHFEQMYLHNGSVYYKCKFCDEQAKSGSTELRLWEMQHLHFEDEDIDILLCPKCKTMSPMDMLKGLEPHPPKERE